MSAHNQQNQSLGSRWGWGVVRASVVVMAIVTGLAAIVVSPLLFRALAQYATGWTDMANVGEAYGGIAALLSGLALGGVVISLLLQWRQNSANRTVAIRQHHVELIKLGIQEPLLFERMSGATIDRKTVVLQMHANLWIGHWAMLWDLKYCDEGQLRHMVGRFFGVDSVARDWWLAHGPMWSTRWTQRRRRFH